MRILRFSKMILAIILLLAFLPFGIVFGQGNIFSLGNFLFGGGGTSSDGNYSLTGSLTSIGADSPLSGGIFSASSDLPSQSEYGLTFVNSAWKSIAPGTDLGSNQRFMSNAFSEIQIAHDRVTKNGQVEVFAGSYDAFHLNRSVTVNIQGDTILNGDLELSTGLLNAPHGILTLTGSFSDQGNHFFSNDGTVKFSGTGEKNLSVAGLTQFSNLSIEAGVTLIENNPANLISINQSFTNHGTIRKTQAITGPGEYTFGLTGATVSNLESEGIRQVQIDQVGQNHSQVGKLPSGNLALPLHYKLTATDGNAKANLCLAYSQAHLASILFNQENSLRLCYWDTSTWSCYPRGEKSNITINTVCAENVPILHNWILAAYDSIPQNVYYFPLFVK